MLTQERLRPHDLYISLVLLSVGILSFRHILAFSMTALDAYPIIAAARIESLQELPSVLVRELRNRIDPGMSYYRPLTLSTYSVDFLIWGLNPRGYHLTDLILHGLATAAVYWLFRVAFGLRMLWAGIAALLFVLHPATVEVVPAVTRRQEPLLVLGFALTLLGARGILSRKRSAWVVVLAGTVVAVTSVERGMMVPALACAYFFCFGDEHKWRLRLWTACVRSLPSALVAVAFYVLRGALFEDSRIGFSAANLVSIPALVALRTLYPQELLGRLRADSPLSDLLLAGTVAAVIGSIVVWLMLRSPARRMHLFVATAAGSYVLLFSVAGIFNSWYIYTIVPFAAFSITLLLSDGVQGLRSGDRRRGVISVLAGLLLVALSVVPSPLFFDYSAWRIASELGSNALGGIHQVTRSLPANTAVVVMNTPMSYVESRANLVQTRGTTILYPKSVRTWAKLHGVRHRIAVFGAARFEGEFTTPEIDFAEKGVVRINFAAARAQYVPTNDPHVTGIRRTARGSELAWPPRGLGGSRFEVYLFDGRELVHLARGEETPGALKVPRR